MILIGLLLLALISTGCSDKDTNRETTSKAVQSSTADDRTSQKSPAEYNILMQAQAQIDSVISAEDEQGTFYRASSAVIGIREYAVAAIKATPAERTSEKTSDPGVVRLRTSEVVEVTDRHRQSAILAYIPEPVKLYRVQMFQLPTLSFRPLPSIYIVCQQSIGSTYSLDPPYFCVFPKWSVIYSRQHDRGVPLWACALDSTGSVVAKAYVTYRGEEMFSITEVHCAPTSQESVYGDRPLCARTADYDANTGLRVRQSILGGSLQDEYFFLWPVGSM
jgi:hypothetical protein